MVTPAMVSVYMTRLSSQNMCSIRLFPKTVMIRGLIISLPITPITPIGGRRTLLDHLKCYRDLSGTR